MRYRGVSRGFALPTVVITATILLAVMVSVMSTTSSTNTSVSAQYYEGMASDAAESGAAVAKNCLKASGGTASWTNGSPLRPGSACTGASTCSAEACFLVFESSVIRTTYTVSAPEVGGGSNVVKSVGTVELLRASDGSVWKRFSHTAKLVSVSVSSGGRLSQTLTAGYGHTCALDNAGKTYCWGSNSSGQLGDGTTTNRPTPVDISGKGAIAGKTIVSLMAGEAGAYHTCALDNAGKTYCWGRNNYGQLGDNTTTDRSTPGDISGNGAIAGKTIVSLVAGSFHTCALDNAGKTYCWGLNSSGQLGDGTTTDRRTPVDISSKGAIAGKTIVSLVAGNSHTCALDNAGKTYCWGLNGSGQLGDGTTTNRPTPVDISGNGAIAGKTIVGLMAGGSLNCALDNAGKTYCWGWNVFGQLGDGTTTNRPTPVDISGKGAIAGKTIVGLAAGYGHTCALDNAGKTYCWGTNSSGQLGDGTISSRNLPVAISNKGDIAGKTIVGLTAGDSHTCALDNAGKTYCWGSNVFGQLGDGTTINRPAPVDVSGKGAIGGHTLVGMGAGYFHSCAFDNAGHTYCWGNNGTGQLGDGTTTNRSTPVDISAMGAIAGKTIVSLAAGDSHSCALDNAGHTYCWGYNHDGQVGNGNTATYPSSPVDVSSMGAIAGKTIVSLTAGGNFTCALDNAGKTYCWGTNYYNELGDGTTTSRTTPVDISGNGAIAGKTIVSLASGANHTCALDNTGKTYCWGANSGGRLGDGTTVQRSTPVDISTKGAIAGKTIVRLAASGASTCALDNTGKTYCWGYNGKGQLGNGTTTDSSTPVDISAMGAIAGKIIVNLAVGRSQVCALDNTGKTYCWGDGGTTGDGTSTQRTTPVDISGKGAIADKTIVSLVSGGSHSCAIDDGGSQYCWGSSDFGSLGDGTGSSRNAPVSISYTNIGAIVPRIPVALPSLIFASDPFALWF